MKKISEVLNEQIDKPDNVRFLNDAARAHWVLTYGVRKDLIMVSSQDLDCELFTQEAFSLLQPHLMGLISQTYISPEYAAQIGDWVWTTEDVHSYLATKGASK